MARAPKLAVAEEAPQPATTPEPTSLRDELVAVAAAALAAGDHAAHALADSLLQDIVAMRGKLASIDGEVPEVIARLKALI